MIAFLILISDGLSNPQYLKRSIEDSLHFDVVVDDILGDEDGYDSDPMQVTTHVNCMIWLQWVLARYYIYQDHGIDVDSIETTQVKYLNEIRYFQRPYTFGNRIHYVDRWIFVGQNHLVPNASCQRSKIKSISLPLSDFFKSKAGMKIFMYQRQIQSYFLTRQIQSSWIVLIIVRRRFLSCISRCQCRVQRTARTYQVILVLFIL